MVDQYRRGATFERKIVSDLRAKGYETIRAAGSRGSSKVDIFAWHPDGQLLFVQCKINGKLPSEEWNRVREVASWVGAQPVLATNNKAIIQYWYLVDDRVHGSREWPKALIIL